MLLHIHVTKIILATQNNPQISRQTLLHWRIKSANIGNAMPTVMSFKLANDNHMKRQLRLHSYTTSQWDWSDKVRGEQLFSLPITFDPIILLPRKTWNAMWLHPTWIKVSCSEKGDCSATLRELGLSVN